MKVLLINIQELLQVRDQPPQKLRGAEMQHLPILRNAWLLLNKGLIEDYGTMEQPPKGTFSRIIDCTGRIVMPTWCDSHTHLVYAGNREQEFIDRIKGLSYQEIAKRGGGILNSAQKLQQTTEKSLFEQSFKRLEEVVDMGTGAIEIKSGYGLTVESELKMLRVARKLAKKYPVAIKTTFLGAHAVPSEFREKKSAIWMWYAMRCFQGLLKKTWLITSTSFVKTDTFLLKTQNESFPKEKNTAWSQKFTSINSSP